MLTSFISFGEGKKPNSCGIVQSTCCKAYGLFEGVSLVEMFERLDRFTL